MVRIAKLSDNINNNKMRAQKNKNKISDVVI